MRQYEHYDWAVRSRPEVETEFQIGSSSVRVETAGSARNVRLPVLNPRSSGFVRYGLPPRKWMIDDLPREERLYQQQFNCD